MYGEVCCGGKKIEMLNFYVNCKAETNINICEYSIL